MYLGIVLFLIAFVGCICEAKGVKNFLTKEGGFKEVIFPMLIGLAFFLCVGYIISGFIGICITDIEKIYDANLVSSEPIESYNNSDTFNVGFNGEKYMYNIQTSSGLQTKSQEIHGTYINKMEYDGINEPTVETYEYEFKHKWINVFAISYKKSYIVLRLPKDYQVVNIK